MAKRRARQGRKGRAPRRDERLTVRVTGVASRGDGEALSDDGRRLYIPFAAPGDEVEVVVGPSRGNGFAATVERRLVDGPRRDAICDHFGRCGGCAVQHLPDDAYRAWKRDILVAALAHRGLTVAVDDLVSVPIGTRRRVTFSAVAAPQGIVLGLAGRRSREIVDIAACPLLAAPLNTLIPALRALAGTLLRDRERARFAVNLCQSDAAVAVDLVIGRARPPDLAEREGLAAFAETHDLARVSWREGEDGETGLAEFPPEPVAARRAALNDFAGVAVDLPAGAFLQPSRQGEDILRRLVLDRVPGDGRVLELFCGAGTFTLALAAGGRTVQAVDGDGALVAALQTAAGRAGLGGRISAQVRDLAARPLLAEELKGIDTVVLDPPRAGAAAQAAEIARTAEIAGPGGKPVRMPQRVVMVSCNPASFARDARILADGGFRPVSVTPVDQFLFSHHLECVGLFDRVVA